MKAALSLCLFLLLASPALAQPPEMVDLGQFRVDTDLTFFTFGAIPAVAHDRADGSFVIVWASYSSLPGSYSTDLLARRYDAAGMPVGEEFLVNQETDLVQLSSSLSPDPDTGFVVAWGELDPNTIYSLGISAQRIDAAGQPLGDQLTVDPVGNDQTLTSVSHAPDRSFLVIWEEGNAVDGSSSGIRGRRYDATGAATGDEFPVNSYTTGGQDFPRVSHGPDGTAVVVWDGPSAVSPNGIQARILDPSGLPTGSDFEVSDSPTSIAWFADVSHGVDGSFVIVWDSQNGPPADEGILARRYDANGLPLGEPFRVDGSDESTSVPRVSHGPNGSFLVVWQGVIDGDFPIPDIRARLFDSLGQPIGEPFRVNDFENDAQSAPDLSFGMDGQLVVTWLDDAGNDSRVFGKLYQVNLAPPEPIVEVPTLGHLGVALLILLLASVGVRRLS